jgi:hypothetical protein
MQMAAAQASLLAIIDSSRCDLILGETKSLRNRQGFEGGGS